MINKKAIQQKIIEGKTGLAIAMLLKLTEHFDSELYNEIIMLSARYHSLKNEIAEGRINDSSAIMNTNRINYSITHSITKVKEYWHIDEEIKLDEKIKISPIEPKSKVKKILFLAANPKDTDPLRLDEEIRKIEEGLKRSDKRDFFELKQKWAVQITDLRRALLEENPNIIHFSGHGSKLGRIYLENPMGRSVEVDPTALAGLFELFEQIECVLLNGCYTEPQAQEISKHIDYVIGMTNAVPDKAAIAFSEAFYDAIANGRDIEFSFKLAKNAISFYNLDATQAPVLIRKMH